MISAIRHCDFPCFFLTFTKGYMNCIVWPKKHKWTQSKVDLPNSIHGGLSISLSRWTQIHPSSIYGSKCFLRTFSRGVWNILEPSWNYHEPSAQSWRYDKTPLRKSFSDQFLVGVHQQTEQKPGEGPKEQSQQTTIWQSDI